MPRCARDTKAPSRELSAPSYGPFKELSPCPKARGGGGRPANAVRLLRETMGRSPSARRGDFLAFPGRRYAPPGYSGKGSSPKAAGRSADGPAGVAPSPGSRNPERRGAAPRSTQRSPPVGAPSLSEDAHQYEGSERGGDKFLVIPGRRGGGRMGRRRSCGHRAFQPLRVGRTNPWASAAICLSRRERALCLMSGAN